MNGALSRLCDLTADVAEILGGTGAALAEQIGDVFRLYAKEFEAAQSRVDGQQ